jgi:hypothetical protein
LTWLLFGGGKKRKREEFEEEPQGKYIAIDIDMAQNSVPPALPPMKFHRGNDKEAIIRTERSEILSYFDF